MNWKIIRILKNKKYKKNLKMKYKMMKDNKMKMKNKKMRKNNLKCSNRDKGAIPNK